MQTVDEPGARPTEILDAPLRFANRLSHLTEVARQRQFMMPAQNHSGDAAAVDRIVFVLAVECPLAVGP
jgi:hypothetical protein